MSEPPTARIEAVSDSYFNETLTDPYRWMENSQDPHWWPYLHAQNNHTRATLDGLPQRAALQARIEQISGCMADTGRVQRCGARIFFQQRAALADTAKLLLREAGQDRVLVDPAGIEPSSGHFSIDWWNASPDGSHVAYGISRDGSEDSVLHVLRVDDGRDLGIRIPGTALAEPQWRDDGSGFFYTQLTGKLGTPERFLDSQVRFHRLGADPQSDPVVMRRGLVPGLDYDRALMPFVKTYAGSAHVLLWLTDVRPEARVFIADADAAQTGHARWTPVADFDNEITGAVLAGDVLTLLATSSHPRGRLLRTSASSPDFASAVEILPEGSLVIEALAQAKDALYLKMMDGGLSRLHRLNQTGATDVTLPFDGAIGDITADGRQDGVLLRLTNWLTPPGIWSVGADGTVSDTGLAPTPPIDLSGFEAQRLFAKAADGTRIPYSLVMRRDLVRDGSNPAFVSAYGSYGDTAYQPSFAGRLLALIESGFVVGYAHVRGGGEFGRAWHRAGQLDQKPNSWRDLIAVCDDMCEKSFASPARLAIGGRSAGGVVVGRAMTERPELFAALVCEVGWFNPLRYVAEQNSFGEEPEWGSLRNEAGYRALKSIDSYQSVQDGRAYPAVLLTTGITDPRVAPFHAAKMAARLQAASSSGKPVLLRVDFDAGHGIGSTRSQQDRAAADMFAFLIWQTSGSLEGENAVFFEKKNQKTFASLGSALPERRKRK